MTGALLTSETSDRHIFIVPTVVNAPATVPTVLRCWIPFKCTQDHPAKSVLDRRRTYDLYKAKTKAYNTCRAPQVTYRDFRGAGHVTGQASVGRRP